jgi:hypothetical protein
MADSSIQHCSCGCAAGGCRIQWVAEQWHSEGKSHEAGVVNGWAAELLLLLLSAVELTVIALHIAIQNLTTGVHA